MDLLPHSGLRVLFFMQHGAGVFNLDAVAGFGNWFATEFGAPFPLLMPYLRFGVEFFGGLLLVKSISLVARK